MTRESALRNILNTVFSCLTIGAKDGRINKKISFYKKCTYNANALENFRELFKIAFIVPDPVVITGNSDLQKDEVSFDRRTAIKNALYYLDIRGVPSRNIDDIEECEQCRFIYSVFSRYILPTIMSADSKEQAETEDITDMMLYALSQTFPEWGKIATIHSELICEKYNRVEAFSYNKSEKGYEMDLDYWNDIRFHVFERFYNLSVYYIIEWSEDDKPFSALPTFDKNSFQGKLFAKLNSSENTYLGFSRINYYPYSNELNRLKKWRYVANIDERSMMNSGKHCDLFGKINDYYVSLKVEAEQVISERIDECLQPHFERLCDCIEETVKEVCLLNLSKEQKKNIKTIPLPDYDKLRELLVEKAEGMILDFEVADYFLNVYRKADYTKALFIMLQNLTIDLSEYLNEMGTSLSGILKTVLPKERYEKHVSTMKRRLNSKELEVQKQLETRLYKERSEEYKKQPESVKDFFYTKRPFVYSNLYNALDNYVSKLMES